MCEVIILYVEVGVRFLIVRYTCQTFYKKSLQTLGLFSGAVCLFPVDIYSNHCDWLVPSCFAFSIWNLEPSTVFSLVPLTVNKCVNPLMKSINFSILIMMAQVCFLNMPLCNLFHSSPSLWVQKPDFVFPRCLPWQTWSSVLFAAVSCGSLMDAGWQQLGQRIRSRVRGQEREGHRHVKPQVARLHLNVT